MKHIFYIALCPLLLALTLWCVNASANTDMQAATAKSVRSIVTGIVSYTRWPSLDELPRLCIYRSARYYLTLSEAGATPLPYIPVVVHDAPDALAAGCNAIYFGAESPADQLELIKRYQGKPLLLIAEQNPECVIGSAFCLIIRDDIVRFSVNLDALSRSGVRVNPDVLILARNKKHE